jgi:hypothetical protein
VSDDRVKAAEFEVDRARAKLLASLNDVSHQFEPHRLMQEAWEKAKDKGADLAEDAVDAVSRRPLTTGAVIAGVVAFLARDSLINAAGKLIRGKKGKSRRRRKAPDKAQTEAAE